MSEQSCAALSESLSPSSVCSGSLQVLDAMLSNSPSGSPMCFPQNPDMIHRNLSPAPKSRSPKLYTLKPTPFSATCAGDPASKRRYGWWPRLQPVAVATVQVVAVWWWWWWWRRRRRRWWWWTHILSGVLRDPPSFEKPESGTSSVPKPWQTRR